MLVKDVWVNRIFADGRHNAFTDICRFGDHYYVTFRNADWHGSDCNGRTFVLRSTDLEAWEQVADIGADGDLRDPKFQIVGDKLHVYHHLAHGATHVSITSDGANWSAPKPIYTEGPWLWRVRKGTDGFYYSVPYVADVPKLQLLRSRDGVKWETAVDEIDLAARNLPKGYRHNEVDLAFLADGTLIAAIRSNYEGVIASAQPPYDRWLGNWTGISGLGGAALWVTEYGVLLSARRSSLTKRAENYVWWVSNGFAVNAQHIPSGGDCSYGTNGRLGDGLLRRML